jgi:hypothetical protein
MLRDNVVKYGLQPLLKKLGISTKYAGLHALASVPKLRLSGKAMARSGLVGIENGRVDRTVKGYHSRPCGCEVGSQFHRYHVSRSPPIMPDGRVSQVRFEALAFQP